MPIEIGEGVVFDGAGPLADEIGVWQLGPSGAVALAEGIAELAEDLLEVFVGEGVARSGEEFVVRVAEVGRVGHGR